VLKSERRVIKKREVKKRCSGLFGGKKGKVNKTRNNEKPTDRLSGQMGNKSEQKVIE
jgi:hypothetical protein